MNNQTTDKPYLLTKKMLARRLSVSVRTIDNWMADGVIGYHKIRSTVRFDLDEVREDLRRYKVSSQTHNANISGEAVTNPKP